MIEQKLTQQQFQNLSTDSQRYYLLHLQKNTNIAAQYAAKAASLNDDYWRTADRMAAYERLNTLLDSRVEIIRNILADGKYHINRRDSQVVVECYDNQQIYY